jgi:hypothetical protein
MPSRPALAVLMAAIGHAVRSWAIVPGSFLCFGAALLLTGCAGSPKHPREQFVARQQTIERESVLQTTWEGQPYGVLVDTYGPPLYVMNIPGDRPDEMIAVYGIRDNISRCIDAFTVFHANERNKARNDSTVTSYFCR